MSVGRDADRLRFHPLFYDALSGEFQPPSDEEGWLHTLGRLAYASVLKGEKDWGSSREYIFRYNPSWAASVIVTAKCYRGFDESLITLSSLLLDGPKPHSLTVGSTLVIPRLEEEPPEFKLSVANDGVNAETYVLELGEKLNNAKVAVTEAAQEFFNVLS